MRFEIAVNLTAPPEHVWRCLVDPHLVGACITGLESLTEISADQAYRAVVGFPLGQTRVSCVADVVWLERKAPREAELAVRLALASPSPSDNAVATRSSLVLRNGSPDVTQLHWYVDIAFEGHFAGMPPQLVLPIFEKYSRTFFTCLKGTIEASGEARC